MGDRSSQIPQIHVLSPAWHPIITHARRDKSIKVSWAGVLGVFTRLMASLVDVNMPKKGSIM